MNKHKQKKIKTDEFSVLSVFLSPIKFVVLFLALGMLLMLISSLGVYGTNDPTKYIVYIGKACLYVSCIISGFVLSKTVGQKQIILGMILGSYIMLVVFTISLFNSNTVISSYKLLWYFLIPLTTTLGCTFGIKRTKSIHKKRRY